MKGFQLAIITIYQTVQKSQHGLTSMHTQQAAMLSTEDRQITPRQAITLDLLQMVHNLQQDSVEILIAGDFNAHNTSSGTLSNLQEKCHLFRLNETDGISSFRNGKHCLDHAFGYYKIRGAITQLCFEEYPQDYYSNHRPLFIQINMKSLHSTLSPCPETKHHRLFSKDYANVTLYIEKKHKLMH
jgi:hypothetical protein